jgi:anti-sigma regulatory factor (Ser/Thr protein kinase)
VGNRERAGAAWPAHAAFLYAGAEEFAAGALAFVTAGLDAGAAVLVGVPEPGTGLLRDQLDGRAAQVSWADISQVGANPARIIPWIRTFAEGHPGQPVRCLQEPAWAARTSPELGEVFRHEALVNLAFVGTTVSIMCPYDTAGPDPAVIRSAELTHPALVRSGHVAPSPGYDAEAWLPGERDRPLSGPPEDAAVLAYRADLATVRAFAARHARRAGLAAERALDLVLAVGELAANTFRYSHGGGVAAIWTAGNELICQIEDTGHITDLLAGQRQAPADAGGGHGLWLVHQVCDLVELRSGPGRTVIRMHMRLGS